MGDSMVMPMLWWVNVGAVKEGALSMNLSEPAMKTMARKRVVMHNVAAPTTIQNAVLHMRLMLRRGGCQCDGGVMAGGGVVGAAAWIGATAVVAAGGGGGGALLLRCGTISGSAGSRSSSYLRTWMQGLRGGVVSVLVVVVVVTVVAVSLDPSLGAGVGNSGAAVAVVVAAGVVNTMGSRGNCALMLGEVGVFESGVAKAAPPNTSLGTCISLPALSVALKLKGPTKFPLISTQGDMTS